MSLQVRHDLLQNFYAECRRKYLSKNDNFHNLKALERIISLQLFADWSTVKQRPSRFYQKHKSIRFPRRLSASMETEKSVVWC